MHYFPFAIYCAGGLLGGILWDVLKRVARRGPAPPSPRRHELLRQVWHKADILDDTIIDYQNGRATLEEVWATDRELRDALNDMCEVD